MSPRNKILLALLVGQLALVAIALRPDRPPAAAEHLFLPGVLSGEIRALAITDEDQGVVRLARAEQGWIIAEVQAGKPAAGGLSPALAPPLPADDTKVENFIRQLTELKSDRLVSRTRTSQGRLKVAVEQFVRRVELTTGDGRTRTLFLGTSPSFKSIHARGGDQTEVYLVEGLTSWEVNTQPASWWENDYLDLEPEELRAVTLTNAHGRLQLIRGADNDWQLAGAAAGEQISAAAVEELLDRIGYIPLTDYLGREGTVAEKAFGLTRPAATLVLDRDGQQLEVRIGPEQADSGQRVVKSSASPFYAKVASHSLNKILEQTRTDLLVGNQGLEGSEDRPAE